MSSLRLFLCSHNLFHIRGCINIFYSAMADMELRAFEARLDVMVDQVGEESAELIIERPRFAHAVMVFANGNEPGELLTVEFDCVMWYYLLVICPTDLSLKCRLLIKFISLYWFILLFSNLLLFRHLESRYLTQYSHLPKQVAMGNR